MQPVLAGAQEAAGSSGSPVGTATGVPGPVPHPQEAQPDSDSLRRACGACLPPKGCPAAQPRFSHASKSPAQAGVQAGCRLRTRTCPCTHAKATEYSHATLSPSLPCCLGPAVVETSQCQNSAVL